MLSPSFWLFMSCHPQCLWQETHSWVQAINPPLYTSLSLWPHKHSRSTPTEWTDPPSSPPCSQSQPRATSSTHTTAYNSKHMPSQPASTPSPQPQPAIRSALCTPQPGCQQLHTWAQVSSQNWPSVSVKKIKCFYYCSALPARFGVLN